MPERSPQSIDQGTKPNAVRRRFTPAQRLSPTLLRAGLRVWSVHPQFPSDTIRPLLEQPEQHLAAASYFYKETELITLGRLGPYSADGPHLLLRRLNYGRLSHRLRDWFRPSRARRAFRWGLALEAAEVRTPRVVAASEDRCWRMPLRAFLLTEEVLGARNLTVYLEQPGSGSDGFADRLGAVIGRLHQTGFSHRDLTGSNILVDHEEQPWLIDLDGVRRLLPIGMRRAARDLSRLSPWVKMHSNLLPCTESRFLHAYCQARNWTGRESRLARAVAGCAIP
jgi:tRNA A-37 threonylcarbamoyl transferase component Bud32